MRTINNIVVVISTRNAVKWIGKCIDSAGTQSYPYDKFQIIFIDALSDDGTYEVAKEYEKKYSNFKAFQNETRKYQGENILIATKMAEPKSIIITLDGDDELSHENVLARINAEYVKHDCWHTYGRYEEMNPYRDVTWHYSAYPEDVVKNKTFRQYKWQASHLRTFRREIYLKINESDLKDDLTGDFVSACPDLSFSFPIMEMCSGLHKSRFVPDILYKYNVGNPNNESKTMQETIDRIEKQLRARPVYSSLEKLYDNE